MHKLLGSLAVIVIASTDLHAARFDVVHAGRAVENAQICLFAAGEGTAPLSRFFTSGDPQCAPASEEITIPPGRWNVYAHTDALASDGVALVTAESTRDQRMRIELRPGARISSPNLAEGDRAYAWIARSASAIPLKTTNVLPAGTIIPLMVSKGVITRVGPAITPAAGETRTIDFGSPRAGRIDAVVPLAIRNDFDGPAPLVTITDATGAPHEPLAQLEATSGETLLFFREVPRGTLTATLDGERWKRVESSIEAAAAPAVAVFETPLEAILTTKLLVHWWTTRNLDTLAGRPSCEPEEVQKETFTATLLSCPDPKREWSRVNQCIEVESRDLPLDELSGDVVFEDAPVGTLRVRFAYPGLPPLTKDVPSNPDETTKLDAELRWFTFFGTVTRKGEPVAAEVFGTVSDPETGRYDAALPRTWPAGVPWTVKTCDGTVEYMIVPDEVPAENTRYDIEIDDNRIVIDVIDAATRQPIPQAQVGMGALMKAGDTGAHFAGPAGKTDEKGQLIIAPVLSNKTLHICASHDDYLPRCADEFSMKEMDEKRLELALDKADVRTGRIITPTPFQYGTLVWYGANRMSEHIRIIGETPVFKYRQPHTEGETVAFTADGQPLYVFRYPRLTNQQEFVIQLPQARRRTFTVTLSDATREEGGFVALQIGDLVVPINMIGYHAQTRRFQSSLRPGQTITIADVLETGPITAIFVPFSALKAHEGQNVELPFVPEFATFRREELGNRDAITFE